MDVGNWLTVEEIIEKIKHSQDGEIFQRLFYDGDISGYPSHSEADLALMNRFPFWTNGNPRLMEELFSLSALGQRNKWLSREDYRKRTIETALKGWNGVAYTMPKLETLPLTDEGNAKRVKMLYGNVLRFVDGGMWYKFNGKYWETIKKDNGIFDLACEAMKKSREACFKAGADEKVLKFFRMSTNTPKVKAMIEQLKGLLPARATDFDKDKWKLNCLNGVVDLKTGKLLPHDGKYMQSHITNAELHDSISDKGKRELELVLQSQPDPETRRYLQKWGGYMLTGDTGEEKILFLVGEGGSGKSTFINAIYGTLGTYAGNIDVEVLLARNNIGNGEGATPQMASLVNKRLALTSESNHGRNLNEAKIKLLTGNDQITARFLNCQSFTYEPSFKLVIQSNYLPNITNGRDTGIIRRLAIVPFEASFAKMDRGLKERLKEPDVRNAILRWLVDGCLFWQKEGLDNPPPAVQAQIDEYIKDNDPVGNFLEACCKYDGKGKTTLARLHDCFCFWYDGNTYKPAISAKSFSKQVQSITKGKDVMFRRTTGGMVFYGLTCNYDPSE